MQKLDIAANRRATKYTHNERLLRVLWMLGAILFRCSFRTMFGWRCFLLKLFGARIGKNVNIYNTAKIYMPWNLEIGDDSAIGEEAFIYNLGKVSIGQATTISQRAHICAGSHDYTDPTLPLLKPPITLGDNVWVCADAFIGPDITIGDGAVVGARAVAVNSVEPWSVVAGNPAIVIKKRVLKK